MSAQAATRTAGPSGPPHERRGAPKPAEEALAPDAPPQRLKPPAVPEIGGPPGPEPTRYGDWEKGGRCTDF